MKPLPIKDCGYNRRDPVDIDLIWKLCPFVDYKFWTQGSIAWLRGPVYACSIGPRGGRYVHILTANGREKVRNFNEVREVGNSALSSQSARYC